MTRWIRRPCALPITRRAPACATRPRSGRESCERRPDAEHDRGHDRQSGAEQQDRQVHLDHRFGGERVGRHPGDDQREAFHAISTPSAAPSDGDRHRLGQQLLHDANACGAERRAHGELLLAVRAAHEQQDRHVGAADEQQRRHGAEQQEEPRPHRPRVHLDDAAQVHAKRVRVARRRAASRTPAGSAAARHSRPRSTRPAGS